MARFVTNIINLKLIKKPKMKVIIGEEMVVKEEKAVRFDDNGQYLTDDKKELEWLRNHRANGSNPKARENLFFEIKDEYIEKSNEMQPSPQPEHGQEPVEKPSKPKVIAGSTNKKKKAKATSK